MAKRQGISINHSPDGPWLTFHGDGRSVTYSLREWARNQMFAAPPSQKRTLSQWLKARDAEDKVEPARVPDVPVGKRLAPKRPPAKRR